MHLIRWLEGEDVDKKLQSEQPVIKTCRQTTHYGVMRPYIYVLGPENKAELYRALKAGWKNPLLPYLIHALWNLNDKLMDSSICVRLCECRASVKPWCCPERPCWVVLVSILAAECISTKTKSDKSLSAAALPNKCLSHFNQTHGGSNQGGLLIK